MSSTVSRRIVLACCSDAGYAPYAATMLYSALCNTPGARFTIYYLHDPGFSEEATKLISKSLAVFGARLEIHFIAVPDTLVQGLPLFKTMQKGALPPVMWYRVFLPQLLPNEPKVLYLDCDTLVVDCLEPLWDTAIENNALAAVTNPVAKTRAGETPWYSACGLRRNEDYFNSGVMLMNLDYFRAHDVSRRVVQHGLANADWVRFGDQDSLVVILHAARVPLHPRWNLLRLIIRVGDEPQLFERTAVSEAIRRPAILHFEGVTKPWVDPTHHPFGRAFTHYARRLEWQTPHFGVRLLDIENFLLRRQWIRLHQLFRRIRLRLNAKRQS